MFQLINSILLEFMKNFKRVKTWQWFVVLMMGFMLRGNRRGVTSIVSSLRLRPGLYHTMLHFFRSTGYTVGDLYNKWIKIVIRRGTLWQVAGYIVLLGDHIKISKEGRRMPDIQTMHQESQNSGKAEYIEGHTYGHVSAVITNGKSSRSIPLITELQKSPPRKEGTKKPDGDTLVVQMVNLVYEAAKSIGKPVIAALDAYFSSRFAWATADKAISETGERLVEIVTRAQTNTVAYTVPGPQNRKRRGAPRKYGDKIVLYKLFNDMSRFKETTMGIYGKQSKVRYLCLDLIWKPVKKLVRFVAVEVDGDTIVLMSTSLALDPRDIITIYVLRFKIETSFGEQKNEMGCFGYHFWTTALPKRKKWKKFDEPQEEKLQKRINEARRAAASFVCLSTIATGILTIIAFSHSGDIWKRYPGWIRTLRSTIPSIAIIRETIAQDFHAYLQLHPHVPICSIIKSKLRKVDFLYDDVA